MGTLVRKNAAGKRVVALDAGARALFLTKDPETIRAQLRGDLRPPHGATSTRPSCSTTSTPT